MSYSWWTDKDLGAAFDARDYSKMSVLISKGASFNACDHWAGVGGASGKTSAFHLALWQEDPELVRFMVNNGCIIDRVHMSGKRDRSDKSLARENEIVEFLCATAFDKIQKSETPVFPDVVDAIVDHYKLEPKNFLKKELAGAAKTNDTKAVAKILAAAMKEKSKIEERKEYGF